MSTDKPTLNTVAPAHPEKDAVADKLLAGAGPSVFQIQTETENGTGWMVKPGVIVTDYHVIKGNQEIRAVASDGTIYRLGKQLWTNAGRDLAMMTFEGAQSTAPSLRTASSSLMNPGDKTFSVGWKSGLGLDIYPGVYVGYTDKPYYSPFARQSGSAGTLPDGARQWVHLQNNAGRGMSGGPDFNAAGEVVSVVDRAYGDQEGQALSNPIEYVKEMSDHPERFRMTEGAYENGFQALPHFVTSRPLHAGVYGTAYGLGITGGVRFGLTEGPLSIKRGLGGALAATVLGVRTWQDVNGLVNSANAGDQWKYGVATAFDATMAVGLVTSALSRRVPGLALASGILIGTGLGGRIGAELIPNRFVVDTGNDKIG
jgi:hypothetical protein